MVALVVSYLPVYRLRRLFFLRWGQPRAIAHKGAKWVRVMRQATWSGYAIRRGFGCSWIDRIRMADKWIKNNHVIYACKYAGLR